MRPINVFIGFDPRETAAFHVLAHSIHTRASKPVSVTPLSLATLSDVLTRPRDQLQSTDFAFSRFLTPYLSGYSGWSVYMDCDMLMRDDINELYALRDERYAVMVVKQAQAPTGGTKFLGQRQTAYPQKNWSSVMLFNNARCEALTPAYVNAAPGLELHQFGWLSSPALIGRLPDRWNHLVGVRHPRADVSLVHYTLGGPYFNGHQDCEYSGAWYLEYAEMLCVDQQGNNLRRAQ